MLFNIEHFTFDHTLLDPLFQIYTLPLKIFKIDIVVWIKCALEFQKTILPIFTSRAWGIYIVNKPAEIL